jgi:linoleoyl-CoA desaturase
MSESEILVVPESTAPRVIDPDKRLKFGKNNEFQQELRRRVEAFFKSTGRRQRDCWQMYLKTAVLALSFAALYVGLVFFAHTWWEAVPLAIVLGLTAAAVAFNIQHDGGHEAYSNHPWINKIAAKSLDMLGGSSYLWRWKHGVFHHTYVNITGHDTDIDLGILGRLTPHQKLRSFHRWQFIYLWPLYGLITIKWQLFDDFRDVLTGHVGTHRVPRPKGRDLVVFLLGKLFFITMALGIPLLVHPVWKVLLFYGISSLVTGVVLSVVFQLAHCVEDAEFPMPQGDTGEMENAWAIHQTETTVDFGRRSRIMAWLLGGLNFQIEHHLFPRICHVNYPAMSPVVEQTCQEFGVRYSEHKTFLEGLESHARWLRSMGMPNAGDAHPA